MKWVVKRVLTVQPRLQPSRQRQLQQPQLQLKYGLLLNLITALKSINVLDNVGAILAV